MHLCQVSRFQFSFLYKFIIGSQRARASTRMPSQFPLPQHSPRMSKACKRKSHIHTSSNDKETCNTDFSFQTFFPLGFPVHKAWSCYENQNISQPFNLLNLKMQVTKVSYWVDNDILPFLRVKHPLNANSTFHSPLFQLVVIQPFRPRKYNMWKQTIKTASLCLARIVSMVVIWCYWIPVKSSVDDMHFVCNYKTWKTKANCNPRFGPHIDSMVIEWCQWINVKANVDDMWL